METLFSVLAPHSLAGVGRVDLSVPPALAADGAAALAQAGIGGRSPYAALVGDAVELGPLLHEAFVLAAPLAVHGIAAVIGPPPQAGVLLALAGAGRTAAVEERADLQE